jgi:hypothetical protein
MSASSDPFAQVFPPTLMDAAEGFRPRHSRAEVLMNRWHLGAVHSACVGQGAGRVGSFGPLAGRLRNWLAYHPDHLQSVLPPRLVPRRAGRAGRAGVKKP